MGFNPTGGPLIKASSWTEVQPTRIVGRISIRQGNGKRKKDQNKLKTPFNKWKPIEIMLALLFLVAPFYYHAHIGGTGLRLPNNIMVWIVANIIGWYSLYLFATRAKLSLPKYFRYIIAFPILATISGFISGVDNPIEWLFRLLFIWCGLLFFIGLFQHKLTQGRIDRLLFIIVISALMQACVGIIQMSFNELPIWFPSSQAQSPYGMFQQINNQATYQVTALIIAIFLITRPYITKGAIWKRITILVFFALTAFIISYSGSRIALLAVLIALPFAIKGRWQLLNKNKQLAIASAIFVMIGVGLGQSGLGNASDKMAKIADGYSASARLGIYAVSIDLIKEKPLFGHGIGNFRYKWQYEKADFYKKHPDAHLIDQYVTHPHNELLFWMIEGGVVAVAGIFILIAGILLSIKGKNRHRSGIYLALLIPIAIHTQVELPFYISSLHWFLALFLLFVLMKANTKEHQLNLSFVALQVIKLFSVVMFVIGTAFLMHSFWVNKELSKKNTTVAEVSKTSSNPYFYDIVESMQMKSILSHAFKSHAIEDIDLFTHWAESFLPKEPSAQLFIFLAMAYQELDKRAEMCRTIKVGQSIYPNDKSLIDGVANCNK